MFDDETFLPVSGLQHYAFCPRQCALIHIEREWQENVLTARGRIEHTRVHEGYKEFRRGRRQISGLYIRSEAMQLQGQIDILELELIDAEGPDNLQLFYLKGSWQIYPVEFKHGEPKKNNCDRIQLCAQAMCLEEMTGLDIPAASLFYHRIHRRDDVILDDMLRCETKKTAEKYHAMFQSGCTPAPVYGRYCHSCSMFEICMPKKMCKKTSFYHTLLFTQQEVEK